MKRIFIILIAAFLLGMDSFALTPIEVRDIIVNNEALRLMAEQNRVSMAMQRADNSLSGLEVEFESLFSKSGDTKWNVGVTQGFEWPGVYAARNRKINHQSETSKLEIEAARLDYKVKATRLLVQLNYSQQRILLIDSLIANLQEIDRAVTQALDHGVVTIIDKKKSAVQLANLSVERDVLVENRNALETELRTLAGQPIDLSGINWLDMPLIPGLSSLSNYLEQLSESSEVILAKARIEAARLEGEAKAKSTLPGFAVGYRHAYEERTHYDGFALSVNLPSWGRKKALTASDMSVSVSQQSYNLIEQTERARITAEYTAAESLNSTIRRVTPVALDTDYLRLLRQAKDAGELTMLDYLREQTYYQETVMNLIDLRERYVLLLVSLNRYGL